MRQEADSPADPRRYSAAQFAGDLDELRRRSGLSLRELGRLAGRPASTLGDALSGRRFPRLDTVLAVARACGAEPAEWRRRWVVADRARGGPDADAGGPAGAAPAELPRDARHFTGRLAELDQLQDSIHSGHPWAAIVISGAAGVGKSALAVHWGHRVGPLFPDGQVFLDLCGHQPHRSPLAPEDALEQLLRTLGTAPERLTGGLDERVRRYRSLMAGRRLLLVLDDAVTEEQVRPLLPGSPGCLVIVTSRRLLAGLVARDGAHHVPLGALGADEARALLHNVLGAQRVAGAAGAVDELARLCGYLPLALRIAAAHLVTGRSPSIQDLIADLDKGNRLNALSAYGDGRAEVRSAFDLSYRTVAPDAARLLRRLGLVPGSDVTAGAAAALAEVSCDEATRHLRALGSVCLVQQHTAGRYKLHDLVRIYAAERAAAEDGGPGCAAAIERLLDWYRRAVAAAAGRLYPTNLRLPGPDGGAPPYTVDFYTDDEALAWLEAERSNLTAAIQYAALQGPRPAAWRLADGLRGFFNLRLYAKDWFATARAGLEAARHDADRQAEAATEHSLGLAHSRLGTGDAAIAHFTRALARYRELDHAEGCAYVLLCLSGPYRQLGEPERAVEVLGAALAICRRHELHACEAKTLGDLGEVYRDLGLLRPALAHQRQALTTLQRLGLPQHEAIALLAMGAVYHELGGRALALTYQQQALDLFRAAGNRDGEAYALSSLAVLHSDAGCGDEALACATLAVALADDIGDDALAAEARGALGYVHQQVSGPGMAGRWYRAALDLAVRAGYRYGEGRALLGLATAGLAAGRVREAIGYGIEALALGEAARYRLIQGRALTLLAEARDATGEGELARGYARRALALHRQTGHHPSEARVRTLLHRLAAPRVRTAASPG